MNKKTESYIILKPISERFNKITKEITDDDIKSLIMSELKEQISRVDFKYEVGNLVDEYFDNDSNIENIKSIISDSIKNKFNK